MDDMRAFEGRLLSMSEAACVGRLQVLAPEQQWQANPLEMEGFAIPDTVRRTQQSTSIQYKAVLEDVHVVAGVGAVISPSTQEIISDILCKYHDDLDFDWYFRYGLDARDRNSSRCFYNKKYPIKIENAISFFSWENRNYAHWIFEKLASFYWITKDRFPKDTLILIEDDLPESILKSLSEFWPLDRITLLPRGTAVQVKSLYYFTNSSDLWESRRKYHISGHEFSIYPESFRWLRERITGSYADRETERRNAYLIRSSGGNGRTLTNQDELISVVDSLGFSCIQPGGMDFAGQVNQFSAFQVVVASSGAALANMLWMARGSVIVVLILDSSELFYWLWHSVAEALGIRLIYFPLRPIPHPLLRLFHWDGYIQIERFLPWLMKQSFVDEHAPVHEVNNLEWTRTVQTAWKKSPEFSEWLSARAPSSARVRMILSMLQSKPAVATVGAVVMVSDAESASLLPSTLDSLKSQRRKLDKIWVIGRDIPPSMIDPEIEVFGGLTPWSLSLSSKADQADAPDFSWIIQSGDQLAPHATLTLGEHQLKKPEVLIWYTDEVAMQHGSFVEPLLKPDLNVDLLRSYPYVGRNLIISTAAIREGGLDERMAELASVDLLWRIVEQKGESVIGHVPEVLQYCATNLMVWIRKPQALACSVAVTQAHLSRLGIDAQLTPRPDMGIVHTSYPLLSRPLVSIIIPTQNKWSALLPCVESLIRYTTYENYELVIIDSGGHESAIRKGLSALESSGGRISFKVLPWHAEFNYAAINNFAAAQARGEVLLFLNDDIELDGKSRTDWLDRFLAQALRPEAGIVGTRLDLPQGRGVEQCGLVLGLDEMVRQGFRGESVDEPGYMNRLVAQHNISAVSASCLMMRKKVFDELGGFDAETFPVFYADIDLSLKAAKAGYLLALEPDTGLIHMGGATRFSKERFESQALLKEEVQARNLYARWLPQLANDRYYHPAFDKQSAGFDLSLSAARIHDPLPGRPLPVVLAAHLDWQSSSYHRILDPFLAMSNEMFLEGGVGQGRFSLDDVVRIQPDTIVLQGAWIKPHMLSQIQHYREMTQAKIVLEFDDYRPKLSAVDMARKMTFPGLMENVRGVMQHIDWLVVSSPVLAQEFSDYHSDVRVAMSGLLPASWGRLQGRRRTGPKLRVGWASNTNYVVDLEVIYSVIKELQDEVEWVFLGDRPKAVHGEYHSKCDIKDYPNALAGLNLDLAVLPMQVNSYNRGKNNLNLLELGACGVPVICTSIEPYQGNLPVTLVRNRHEEWVEAIRSHISDSDALARAGDALRDAVMGNWMLEGRFLDQWRKAWEV
ncbi:glycosyltransferase 61 family protein [Pusillimonas sp. SM2304]|uniref:glycosyltransferase n=1 Tax=Pusillimonas sp. SM2304 TaxID=3073241 RepID=UPI002876EDA9|nr:glycosyltransferase 61 family protein [Pusillimonas sp. SM2304]MDS1141171.1 glycosyltransferase 61 family protein [Pusillimonas sp. SM2304]